MVGESSGLETAENPESTFHVKEPEEKWKLVDAFLKTNRLVEQQIVSFNHFINVDIKKIIKANELVYSDKHPDFYLKYQDVRVGNADTGILGLVRPSTPQECRLRDITYAAPIYVDIEYTRGGICMEYKNFVIGRMPIMLRSLNCILANKSQAELAKLKECPLDPGGYFVVGGKERVFFIQEQLCSNKMFLEEQNGVVICTVLSSTNEWKSRTEVLSKDGRYYLKHKSLSTDIPIVIIFKAMGLESDQEIMSIVGNDEHIQKRFAESLLEAYDKKIVTQMHALQFISSKMKKHSESDETTDSAAAALEFLCTEILPHVPVENFVFHTKCVHVALMVRRVMTGEKDKTTLDDRNFYGNKRFKLCGHLMALLFENLFKRFNRNLLKIADRIKDRVENFDVKSHMRTSILTVGLEYAITTGNWIINSTSDVQSNGFTKVLSRLSYVSMLGMMTSVNCNTKKPNKPLKTRSLQSSQWGVLCPVDTPEGETCGFIRNLALMCYISTEVDEAPVVRLSLNAGVEDIRLVGGAALNISEEFLVMINGKIIGISKYPKRLLKDLRFLRRKNRLGPFVSIYSSTKHRSIYIETDAGRLCRPYIIVHKGQPLVQQEHIDEVIRGIRTFDDFLFEGLIEYLDVNEINESFIALKEEDIKAELTTHLEIEPFSLIGVCAGLIPYMHHNQSSRNTYQCAMGRQSMGIIAYNQKTRMDVCMYNLIYAQTPIVKTHNMELTNLDKMPAGQNAIIAVMSYSGYDTEDAVILNKASVDRGYGRSHVYKTKKATIKGYPNKTSDRLVRATINGMSETLDIDGITQPGETVSNKHILINKHVPKFSEIDSTKMILEQTSLSKICYTPTPLVYKNAESSYVDKAMLTSNAEEDFHIKILLRQTRRPEIGDKFSSRHGQKGVCGLIVEQEDLPFNEHGICPDIIINPHAFPTRMTVGQILELISGKTGSLAGKFHYGNAFADTKIENIEEELVRLNFNYMGKDIFYSGITGDPLEAYIYSGPVFYQTLKHMVQDKVLVRSRGPVDNITRQPAKKRVHDVAFRVGEMERDCLIAYGACMVIMERLMKSSDKFTIQICNTCGRMAYSTWCHVCESSTNISTIKIPYTCKLLFQELTAMNIIPKFTLERY